MHDFEIRRALKILDLLKLEEGERKIKISIERFGMIELTMSWDLKPYEEKKEIYDFFEYFENSHENKIYFKDTTIYINGNSHICLCINALINHDPRKIVYKKELLNLNTNSPADWIHIHKRAKLRNLEIIEV